MLKILTLLKLKLHSLGSPNQAKWAKFSPCCSWSYTPSAHQTKRSGQNSQLVSAENTLPRLTKPGEVGKIPTLLQLKLHSLGSPNQAKWAKFPPCYSWSYTPSAHQTKRSGQNSQLVSAENTLPRLTKPGEVGKIPTLLQLKLHSLGSPNQAKWAKFPPCYSWSYTPSAHQTRWSAQNSHLVEAEVTLPRLTKPSEVGKIPTLLQLNLHSLGSPNQVKWEKFPPCYSWSNTPLAHQTRWNAQNSHLVEAEVTLPRLTKPSEVGKIPNLFQLKIHSLGSPNQAKWAKFPPCCSWSYTPSAHQTRRSGQNSHLVTAEVTLPRLTKPGEVLKILTLLKLKLHSLGSPNQAKWAKFPPCCSWIYTPSVHQTRWSGKNSHLVTAEVILPRLTKPGEMLKILTLLKLKLHSLGSPNQAKWAKFSPCCSWSYTPSAHQTKRSGQNSHLVSAEITLPRLTKPGEVGKISTLLHLGSKVKLMLPCFFLKVTPFLQILIIFVLWLSLLTKQL